jgi:polar amino acid transport system substrate-binding protein
MRKAILVALPATLAAAVVVAGTASGDRTAAAAIPGCAKDNLNLQSEGRLTIGADNPAFPPWFGGKPRSPWKTSDPRSGQGYESAVAYAIARQLAFTKSQVTWTYVPFARSFRPGSKPFDFYITQVSYSPERDRVVDFSRAYYFLKQAVVGIRGKPITRARTVADLRPYRLGAQFGTTSYNYITRYIRPSSSPRAYDTNDLAVQALKNGQIDGIVVDTPTTYYVTTVQIPNSKVVGQLPTRGAKERLGLVFERGNSLRSCVNRALDRLWRNGTIKALQGRWLSKVERARQLK